MRKQHRGVRLIVDDIKECQQFLKVGKNTMLELLHTNQIDGFKIGSRWKIKKESVVEFLRYKN